MDNYFLISEFAKLRDININSLRYYEKLGILRPAYVDEKNGYRYYSAEQLPLLNNIILCVQLGIPLKEMQNNLKYIETSLKNMEENRAFLNREGMYHRNILERRIITTDFYTESLDVKKVVSEIYKIAQKNDFFPILSAGQILELDENGKINIRFFLEVLCCEHEHPRVEVLPAGEYSCIQLVRNPEMDLEKRVREIWKVRNDSRIIIENIVLDKYSFENRPSELQMLESVSHKN